MKSNRKKLWVAALRSGKYEQGKEYLRWGNKFCCLGVLADLISPEEWRKSSRNLPNTEDTYAWGESDLFLPHNV